MRRTTLLLAGLALAACNTSPKDPNAPKKYRAWDNTRSAPVSDWTEDRAVAEKARKDYRMLFPHNQVVIWTQ